MLLSHFNAEIKAVIHKIADLYKDSDQKPEIPEILSNPTISADNIGDYIKNLENFLFNFLDNQYENFPEEIGNLNAKTKKLNMAFCYSPLTDTSIRIKTDDELAKTKDNYKKTGTRFMQLNDIRNSVFKIRDELLDAATPKSIDESDVDTPRQSNLNILVTNYPDNIARCCSFWQGKTDQEDILFDNISNQDTTTLLDQSSK